jgi:anti-repressor protein
MPTSLIDGIARLWIPTCNARELHVSLENRQQFADWIKARIEKYGLVEGAGYVVHKIVNNLGGRPTFDCKEMAMVENNDKGREARRYFLECERRIKEAPALELKIVLHLGTCS